MPKRPLHLAIDGHNLLTDQRGIGRYVREILKRFAEEQELELTLLVRSLLPALLKRRMQRIVPGIAYTLRNAVPQRCDLVWHPWNGTFFQSNKTNVVTIHDTHPFDIPESDPIKRRSQQEPFLTSARKACRVLTVSAYAAECIVNVLAIPRDVIHITHLAPAVEFCDETATIVSSALPISSAVPETTRLAGRPYLLCISSMDRVKNFSLLYEAWQEAFPTGDVALLATGIEQEAYPKAIALPRDSNRERLGTLYRKALALVVPSLSESFGLPVVEAMSIGTPVVANSVCALPEIAGDAALFVDRPESREAWIDALRRIHHDTDLRATLMTRGRLRAAAFSWQKTADATLALFRETAATSPCPRHGIIHR